MYIPNDSNSDSNLRYKGCYVQVKNKLVRISSIERCNEKEVIFFGEEWNKTFFKDTVRYIEKLTDVDTTKVAPQYVNFSPNKGCGLIQRIATNRTYALGTKHNNTEVHVLSGTKTRVEELPHTLSRLNRPYPSITLAYQQVMSGLSPARAVSKRVAIFKQDKVYVLLLNKPIGEVISATEITLIYPHKYFKEELEELGYTITLKELKNE